MKIAVHCIVMFTLCFYNTMKSCIEENAEDHSRPNMTEKLLTRMLNPNTNKKPRRLIKQIKDISTHQPLYNIVHYSMILDLQFKMDHKKYRFCRKMTMNGHFSI